ncbi:hypothetical protein HGA92_03410 [Candidatus Gracilibacteria bacterium]|nr:hypothetical protein [Candidatus Gracilibacteria bacterium]NUJ99145.1 hypothetical protein [Candidatus Gracilibacteria bacterium]
MKKLTSLIFVSLFLIGIIIFLFFFHPALTQEKDSLSILGAIVFIPFSEDGFSEYADNKYVTNATNSNERLKKFMAKKGYIFTEQLGSGYMFHNKKGENFVITGKMFSRFFRIFSF